MHGIEHLIFMVARAITKAACDEAPTSFRSPFVDESNWRRDQRWGKALKYLISALLIAVIGVALWVAWRDG